MAKRIDTNDDQMAMKNNIINAFPGGIVSPAQTEALTAFDAKLVALIVDAKAVGVPQGLIGTGMRLCVNETFVPLFKDQPNNIYIWCNADQYVKDHKLSAFCTGMFISEPQEAYVFGIGATPEQLTYSNRLFSRLVNQGIKTGLSNWRLAEHVLTHYNDPTNSAIEYNRQRIFAFDGGCVSYGHLGSTPAPRAAAYTAA